jgi:hypothetical protein
MDTSVSAESATSIFRVEVSRAGKNRMKYREPEVSSGTVGYQTARGEDRNFNIPRQQTIWSSSNALDWHSGGSWVRITTERYTWFSSVTSGKSCHTTPILCNSLPGEAMM